MRKNLNDRIRVKGTVSKETAELMLRGELKSNNGLRKSFGRGSFYKEQPQFELDLAPTLGQQMKLGLQEVGLSILFEDLIPLGRYLFCTEIAPVIREKLHKVMTDPLKAKQIAKTKTEKISDLLTEKTGLEKTITDNVIDLSRYLEASNQ